MKWALAGLAAITLIRLIVAAVTPLAPDEAYYWVWSRALAAGYVDHPPMVALWIRAGTALAGANPLGVRLLGPLAAALGSWLLYDTAECLFPDRNAGLIAAALLNATLVLGVGAVIMTPDTPLLLFWTATLWAGGRIACGGVPAWWLAAGAFTGLALVSKYTGAFLPFGLFLFALIAMKRALLRPLPWLGLAIAALLFLPVVVWNAQHGWIGFLRQGGRVADWRPERAVQFLAELVGGQIGLATPGVFVLLTAGIVTAVRLTVRSHDKRWTLLAALSVPPVVVFAQHALGDRVQGNWPAIVYPAAAVAASGMVAPVWRRWIWPSCGLGYAIAAALYAHAINGWPAVAAARDPVARQLFGWHELAAQAASLQRTVGADFIVAEPYGLAAELAWTLPSGNQIMGTAAHWLPTTLPQAEERGLGMLIIPERYGPPEVAQFGHAVRLPDLVRAVDGAELMRYGVFLLPRGEARAAMVLLPHR